MSDQAVTPEDAARIIELDRKKKCDDCAKEVQETLDKYNCALDIAALFTTKEPVQFKVTVVSK